LRSIIILLTFSLLILNVVYYLHGYYAHYASEFSGEWQYGYKDSIEYVKSVEKNFASIYVTSDLGRPYIYYLFYAKTDPRIFRNDNVIQRDSYGFVTVGRFGKYNFFNPKTKIISRIGSKNLFIKTPSNVPPKAHILKRFHLLNGDVALVAYEL